MNSINKGLFLFVFSSALLGSNVYAAQKPSAASSDLPQLDSSGVQPSQAPASAANLVHLLGDPDAQRAYKLAQEKKKIDDAAMIPVNASSSQPLITPSSQKQTQEIKAHVEKTFNLLVSEFSLPKFLKGNPVLNPASEYMASHFGNKTFNLCVLNALAQEINKNTPQVTVAVPEFLAISSLDLSDFLNKSIKLDSLWQQFQKLQSNKKDLDQQAIKILTEIRNAIARIFADSKNITPEIQKQIEGFISQRKNALFMVRSTGDEDRTDIANAGGNESVSSVPPTSAAIWQAMGIVVQSYFSEKSLHQRLIANDNITRRFFIPVLIQRMIGEKEWLGKNPQESQIPVSGVMFTRESAGNTPDVVQIQAAYGHNQGVVNSLVAVDTFYSGPSGVVHAIIRKKKDRLVSIKKDNHFVLDRVDNPQNMQSKPSISSQLAHALSKIAHNIAAIYDHPMDIEFVIDVSGKQPIIYLVQARPLIERKAVQSPNYLSDNFIAKIGAENIIKGDTIGVAGGFIRTINTKEEIIMRDELPQALNDYHDNPNRQIIKAVIVTKMAPATSHEATQFKSYEIPILVVTQEKKQNVAELIAQGPILFDTQRALILGGAVDEKLVAISIMQGWYTHPIALHSSIIPQFMLSQESALYTKRVAYIKELQWTKDDKDDLKVELRALLQSIKKPDITRDLLIDILKRILHRVNTITKSPQAKKDEKSDSPAVGYLELLMQEKGKESVTLLDEAQRVVAYAILCAMEILYTYDSFEDKKIKFETKRLSFLYPIKFLEAIVFQEPESDIVAGYSYVQLLKTKRQYAQAIQTLSPSLPGVQAAKQELGTQSFEYIVQLQRIHVLALNDHIDKTWNQFIQQLTKKLADATVRAKNKDLLFRFSTTIAMLQNLKVLDLWMNTSFIDLAQKEKDAVNLCNALINQIGGKDQGEGQLTNKKLIAIINKQKNILSLWEHKIDLWGDPGNFEALYKEFDNQVVQEFIAGKNPVAEKAFNALIKNKFDYKQLIDFANQHAPLIKLFNQAPQLGKLIVLQFFKQFIDLYDRTIKTVTGSPAYKDKIAQTTHFVRLLMPYVALMEQMVSLVLDQEKEMQTVSFSAYLSQLHNAFIQIAQSVNPENSVRLLQSSPNFVVGVAQIGSKIDYLDAEPQSLEDAFTLAHQNMLIILAVLHKTYGIKKDLLPSFLQSVCNSIEKLQTQNLQKVSLLGIDYNFPTIVVYYNLPLDAHGAAFTISYNKIKNTNQVIVTGKILGLNIANRMNVIVAYARLAAFVSNIKLATNPFSTASFIPKEGQHVTEFSWIIPSTFDLDLLTKYLADICNITFVGRFGGAQIDPSFIIRRINAIKLFLPKGAERKLDQLPFLDYMTKYEYSFANWAIKERIRAKEYDKALDLIDKAAHIIIDENKYLPYGPLLSGEGASNVLKEMADNLTIVFKKSNLQKKAWVIAEKILSAKNVMQNILHLFEVLNPEMKQFAPFAKIDNVFIPLSHLYQEMKKIQESKSAAQTMHEIAMPMATELIKDYSQAQTKNEKNEILEAIVKIKEFLSPDYQSKIKKMIEEQAD